MAYEFIYTQHAMRKQRSVSKPHWNDTKMTLWLLPINSRIRHTALIAFG